jgi:hypothetical protein
LPHLLSIYLRDLLGQRLGDRVWALQGREERRRKETAGSPNTINMNLRIKLFIDEFQGGHIRPWQLLTL